MRVELYLHKAPKTAGLLRVEPYSQQLMILKKPISHLCDPTIHKNPWDEHRAAMKHLNFRVIFIAVLYLETHDMQECTICE